MHEIDERLLVRLLGTQEREVIDVAGLILLLGQIQRDGSSVFGGRSGLQTISILLERVQGVGDILKSSQDGCAILFGSLCKSGPGCAFLMQQGPALENRLRHACG